MKEQLEQIKANALTALEAAATPAALEELRVKLLGKKGELTAVLKQMGKLSAEERPVMGQLANDVRAALETAIASRQTVALNQQSGGRMVAVTTEEDQNPNYTAQVISPIIADGEAIGAVLLMSRDNGVKMGDTELKVAETAAGIVGRQMEQ